MPAATSLPALLNTQPIFEAALSAYLTANGLVAYGTRYDGDVTDARIELMFEPGTSQGHCAPSSTTNTGEKENDWFEGAINFVVQTERAKDTDTPPSGFSSVHEYRVALLQALMLRGVMNGNVTGFTAMDLPHYDIVVISRTGYGDDASDDAYDRTALSYGIQYKIKTDAWPTAS